uniref:Glucosidase 2 subunit beta n=1 Tax=Aureoumbra lagunensis TaxID=44058 RepID=A0A7S3NPP4_9STRA|mmetsp:Transcript_21890/g.33713  ORF Transcript_21890/g.33713 Transcript_21890/m.33713 type:complete len:495 (-) Transcript_21890:212-1696(-)
MRLFFVFISGVYAFWGKAKPQVPEGAIACDDGWNIVESERINDDFCDCDDGHDEPRTSACSRVSSSRYPSFKCENVRYESKMIYTSRVNDGVCDCCDGSDEASKIICENVCDAEAAAKKAERERLALVRSTGLAKRREMLQCSKNELAADARAKEFAESALTDLQLRRDQVQDEIDRLEALQRELKSAAEEAAQKNTAEILNSAMDVVTETSQASSAAIRLAVAASEIEALMDATTRLGGLPEEITDKFDDVDILSSGVDGSQAWNDQNLESFHAKCEHLLTLLHMNEIDLEHAKSVALDIVSSIKSLSHTESLRNLDPLAAALGASSPNIEKSLEVLTPEQSQALASAKAAIVDIDAKKRQHDDTLRRIKENEKHDYGPDAAYRTLKGQCFSKRIAKYDYEVCPFGNSKQDHTSIGKFGTWGNDYNSWNFEHGQYCSGVGARTLLVNLRCGDENNLVDVYESEMCKYTATFDTPAACVENDEENAAISSDDSS